MGKWLTQTLRELHLQAGERGQRAWLFVQLPEARAEAVLHQLAAELGPAVALGAGRGVVNAWLGRECDDLVVDARAHPQPDALAALSGSVKAGGVLAVILPCPQSHAWSRTLRVVPHTPEDVTRHFASRLWRVLGRQGGGALVDAQQVRFLPFDTAPCAFALPDARTPAQAALVRSCQSRPGCDLIVAHRGRGKSAALGWVAASLASRGLRVALTAGSEVGARIALRHAEQAGAALSWTDPEQLLVGPAQHDVVCVDEAASLGVGPLRALAARTPQLVLATTLHGYEGTGQGFRVRFVERLRRAGVQVREHALEEPIRWAAGDALERLSFRAWLLDAQAPQVSAVRPLARQDWLDRRQLAADEPALGALYGLLADAHYRTVPSDLWRLLDAPNLSVLAAYEGRAPVGAVLVAMEGGLAEDHCDALARGRVRVRGHLLPEALAVHAGLPRAGRLRALRVVRIAVHRERRREGIGAALLDEVAAEASRRGAQYVGASFVADDAVLGFWDSAGYELARLGTRGSVPSAMMTRALHPESRPWLAATARDTARHWPVLSRVLWPGLDADTRQRIGGLVGRASGDPVPYAEDLAAVVAYAFGARPFECVWVPLSTWLRSELDRQPDLAMGELRALALRLLGERSWSAVARETGAPSVGAALRGVRASVRERLRSDPRREVREVVARVSGQG